MTSAEKEICRSAMRCSRLKIVKIQMRHFCWLSKSVDLPRIVVMLVVLYGARKVSDYDGGVSNRAAMGFFAHFREVYEQRASRESLGLVARLPMHAASNHTTRA